MSPRHGTCTRHKSSPPLLSRQFGVLVGVFSSLCAQDVYAYFDPGTGSLLIQFIVATVAGCMLYCRAIMARVAASCKNISKYLNLPKFCQDKHATLAGVIGMFVAVFYSSHNSDTLTVWVLASNVFLLTSFSFLLVKCLMFCLQKFPQRHSLMNYLIALLFFYYLRFPLGEALAISKFLIFSGNVLVLALSSVTVAGVVYILWRGSVAIRHQQLAIILLLITSIPTYRVVRAIIINSHKNQAVTASYNQIMAGIDSEFQRTPNVYFIVLDSYTSIDGLKVLGLDKLQHTQDFFSALQSKGFTLYPSFFTNFQPTRYAIASYLNMDLHHNNTLIYDVPVKQLQAVAAGNNLMSKIFLANNYERYLLLSDNYLTEEMCLASRCLLGTQSRQFNRYFALFDKVVTNGIVKSLFYSVDKTRTTFQHLAQVIEGNNFVNSYLIFSHLYLPMHTAMSSTQYGHCHQEDETKLYAERLFETHKVMLAEIEKIVAKDKDALVILAGDHGPYILNRCAGRPVMKTAAEVTEPQGAFLAIKWGKDYDGRYDDKIKTSANLFRYIFSHLLGHEQLLKSKPDDDAFYMHDDKIIKSIDDGTIIVGENK